ncbi:uncharacterized protein LOC144589485 [Pogona vitticeps]
MEDLRWTLEEAMIQTGHTSSWFLRSSYENLITAPGDEIHNSAVIQVGRQLAVIGDEYNRTHRGKLEGSLFHLVKRMAASISQTCFWNCFKSVMKSSEDFYNSGWRKKIIDCVWIVCVPLKYLCQKWVPATLFTILMWWLITYGLQN